MRIVESIYVCAPLAGAVMANHKRVEMAVNKLAEEWKRTHGDDIRPLFIVPHFTMRHITYDLIDGELDREWGMACCLELVRMCDTLIVVGSDITMGMSKEIDYALTLNKKVERRDDL
jgi:hypothetical protein